MNTLENKIQEDLTSAMKARDSIRTDVIRGIKTAFMEYKTSANGNRNPDDSELLKIIQKMAKTRKETSEVYKTNGRPDLAKREYDEYEIISEYLPKMLTEDEVVKIVEDTIKNTGATSMKEMGKVMGFISKNYSGQVDNSLVSKIVKSKLS